MAQETVTFALGIPHTPWKPERVKSFERLRDQLVTFGEATKVFTDREPNYYWSERMWGWATKANATHFLTLQDDAIVCPDFWRRLRSMVYAVPDQIIGLEAIHPHGKNVQGCWYRTKDCLVGVGYVMPMNVLRDFLEWRSKLRKGGIETITEDTLIGVYALSTGRDIWHPKPTIIDHDTELPSTYKNDEHKYRRPSVTWKDEPLPVDWTPRDVPQIGRFYEASARMARRWIPGATEENYQRWSER